MDEFVCVRAIMANAMDLTLFQFDYDMSFAVTFLNADKTVYGRYGSRQHRPQEADKHISMEGLAKTMEAILALHQHYPQNQAVLSGKQPQSVEKKRPEEYEKLGKYQDHLDYGGQVAKSCVHCHQIHEAQRLEAWERGGPISDKVLHPWPMPDAMGLAMDPRSAATIGTVVTGSPADLAGLRPGDEITTVAKQPITSIADLQWVLHQAGDEAKLDVIYDRGGESKPVTLSMPKGWRTRVDIEWRTSTWDLRRIVLGGAVLEPVSDEERKKFQIEADAMALRVKHAGRYGSHAVARKAGIRPDDIYVSFDGQTSFVSETALIRHVLGRRKAGDEVEIVYLRDGKRRTAKMKIQ